jgi:hypothetical protein
MKTHTSFRRCLVNVRPSFFIAILLFIFFASWLSTQTASAQDSTIIKPKGLTLSPLRSELDIAPGTSQDGTMTVTNNSSNPMIVDMSAEVFSVINQQYDYAFTAESNVVKWVTFNHSQINLAPDKTEDVTYTVGVPLSAEPGGRYISLFASTDMGTTSGAVESKQQVASLLYITVPGNVTRVGHLVSLTSPWLISGNSRWAAVLQNTGTTHYRSRYNLQIKNLLWSGTAASMSGEALILPGTVRLISNMLPAPPWPGLYRAVYDIGLGDNPAVTQTRLILYMPLWATTLIIIAVASLIYWFFYKKGQLSSK